MFYDGDYNLNGWFLLNTIAFSSYLECGDTLINYENM